MGQTLSLCAGSSGPPCACVCSVCAACMLGVCVHVCVHVCAVRVRACMCSGYVCAHVCVSVLDVCVCVCVCACVLGVLGSVWKALRTHLEIDLLHFGNAEVP